MTCFYPNVGYLGRGGQWVSNVRQSPSKAPMTIPCKRCIGCRMDRAAEWSVRIAHEASLYDESSFLTLTYDPLSIPEHGSLQVRDLQLFLKRLRKSIQPKKVRFFACGEYGGQTLRPHYHVLLFGHAFPDQTLWRKSKTGFPLYRSSELEALWTLGNSEIGSVTRESGKYVAKYCLKKVMGPPAEDHYSWTDPDTGEIHVRKPEFATMSTRPGIGLGWFKMWENDFNPSGFIVIDGQKHPVPRYYKRQLKGRHLQVPEDFWEHDDGKPLQDLGREARWNPQFQKEHTKERLATKEEVARLKAEFYRRPGEEVE